MYKTILVPLDGSTRAEAILPHVEHLAHSCDGRVVLLRVVEPFYDTVSPDGTSPLLDAASVVDEEITSAKAYLTGLQARLHGRGITATQEVVFSASIVGSIIDVARREGADLIAMASHGRTGLARVFYGSVAVGVLHSVDRPLLLVRSRDGE